LPIVVVVPARRRSSRAARSQPRRETLLRAGLSRSRDARSQPPSSFVVQLPMSCPEAIDSRRPTMNRTTTSIHPPRCAGAAGQRVDRDRPSYREHILPGV
jgi:hypothetical protein